MDTTAETTPTPQEPENPLMDGSDDLVPGLAVPMPDIGQKIGPNRVLELIAEGGMANVYKVWHEGLEIVRAVKILKPGFNEESKQRLQTEAKISAHLHHPNIVEIFGVNFWNDLVPYLEMEFIDGFSLKDLLRHHKQVHFTFALSLGYFVCNALHYAHNQVFTLYGKPYQGVVHRDIKPANILLARNGTIKLADFGIAKPSDISLHTVGQKVMGTFTYLSPEQLNGDVLDCRCDIYSLGTVIYEIIAGAKAFPQKTMAELVQKKMVNDYRPLNSFGVDIPGRLVSIIDKSMELNRDKRFSNALEFGEELVDLLKKITPKTPDQIVIDHIKNPAAAPAVKLKKTFHVSSLVIVPMCLVVALLAVALLVFPEFRQKINTGFFTKVRFFITSQVVKAPTEPAFEHPALAAMPQEKIAAVAGKQPVDTQIAHAAASGAPSAEEKNMKKPLERRDFFKKGQRAARLKRNVEASAPPAKNPKGLPDSAVITLLESCLKQGDMTRAYTLAMSEYVNDGYYYLLCGKVFFALGKFDLAIEALGHAQTVRSSYKSNTLQEATYLWAKSLDELFQLKPNSENKKACFRAWRQFSKAFCSGAGATRQCRDATERLSYFKE
jgi:serine/threonine protein kinase